MFTADTGPSTVGSPCMPGSDGCTPVSPICAMTADTRPPAAFTECGGSVKVETLHIAGMRRKRKTRRALDDAGLGEYFRLLGRLKGCRGCPLSAARASCPDGKRRDPGRLPCPECLWRPSGPCSVQGSWVETVRGRETYRPPKPVMVMPCTKNRCAARKRIRMGASMMVLTANTISQRCTSKSLYSFTPSAIGNLSIVRR